LKVHKQGDSSQAKSETQVKRETLQAISASAQYFLAGQSEESVVAHAKARPSQAVAKSAVPSLEAAHRRQQQKARCGGNVERDT